MSYFPKARPQKNRIRFLGNLHLIAQSGIKLESEKLTDPKAEVSLAAGQILQVGKKTFFRIQL